jgi:hypothetical protein
MWGCWSCTQDAATGTTSGTSQSTDAASSDATVGGSDAVSGPDAGAGSDAAAVDAGGPYKYASCSAALNCARVACSADIPSGCAQPCLDAASPQVQSQLGAVLACIDSTCRGLVCPPGSPAGCVATCAFSHCGFASIKCAADGKVGTASCDAVFGCLDKCKDSGDWNCGGACYAGLSAQGQAQIDAVGACYGKSANTDAGKACPGELFQCVGGGKSGFATCTETLTCFDKCGPNGGGCGLVCFQAADVEAQKQVAAAMDCNAQGGGAACVDALLTCVHPDGSKGCTDIIACLGKCKSGTDAGCNYACLAGGSKVEAGKVLSLFSCSDPKCKDKCGADGQCYQACAQQNCPTEVKACLGN